MSLHRGGENQRTEWCGAYVMCRFVVFDDLSGVLSHFEV